MTKLAKVTEIGAIRTTLEEDQIVRIASTMENGKMVVLLDITDVGVTPESDFVVVAPEDIQELGIEELTETLVAVTKEQNESLNAPASSTVDPWNEVLSILFQDLGEDPDCVNCEEKNCPKYMGSFRAGDKFRIIEHDHECDVMLAMISPSDGSEGLKVSLITDNGLLWCEGVSVQSILNVSRTDLESLIYAGSGPDLVDYFFLGRV